MDDNEAVVDNEVVDSNDDNQVDESVDENVEDVPVEETTEEPTEDTSTQPRKYKVKVDDTELEVDEEELLRGYTHNKAADAKMRQAAEVRKQAEQFIEMVKRDPSLLLKHPELGINYQQWIEEAHAQLMEEAMLPPEEKERRDMRSRLTQLEEEKRQYENERQAAELERLTEQYQQEYDKQFTEALQTSGMPKNNWTVARMAYYVQAAQEAGFDDVNAKDIVPLVREDYQNEIREMFGQSNDDTILDILGDKGVERAVSAHLKKVNGGTDKPNAKGVAKNKPSSSKPKYMDPDEWRAEIAKKTGYEVF